MRVTCAPIKLPNRTAATRRFWWTKLAPDSSARPLHIHVIWWLILTVCAIGIVGYCRNVFTAEAGLHSNGAAPEHVASGQLFGAPRKANSFASLAQKLPADFDWEAYTANYGLESASPRDAELHYLAQEQPRVHRRVRVVLTYDVSGGLCNQLLDHIAHIAVGAFLGAEIVLAGGFARDGSYQDDYWQTWPAQWSRVPTSSMLDAASLQKSLASMGTTLHMDDSVLQSPGSFVGAEVDEGDRGFGRNRTMEDMATIVRGAVMQAAELHLKASSAVPDVLLTLKLGITVLQTSSCLHLAGQLAQSLRPAPHLRSQARSILQALHDKHGQRFNAIHLRLENDGAYSKWMGGEEVLWQMYLRYMRVAGFSQDVPCYVASGLLTYLPIEDFERNIVERLKGEGVCRAVVWKESLVAEDAFKGLHLEAAAMVDFAVLAHADGFVGFGLSSFSWLLREYRCMFGIPLGSSMLLDTTRIHDGQAENQLVFGATVTDHSQACRQPAKLTTISHFVAL